MRPIRLHDTRSGELQPLRPRWPKRGLAPEARVTRLRSGKVGIYACGPTVYSRIHIGNARPFVVFSLMKRFLEGEGYETTLVVNVTDVNDKIYDAARVRELPSEELAKEMTGHYFADTDALGLGRPDREPLASETMDAIVAYIRDLIDSGHAYASAGDVYFSVRSVDGYGSLSHRRLDDMDQGEGGSDPTLPDRKRDPLDFALWKAHKSGEDTSWDPRDHIDAHTVPPEWLAGRPGWHIECSAMSEDALGVGFDIHGGGSDLLFPHHENEAAQTRAARGEELARIWMHNGMIQSTGEKMAKSVGNIAPLHEVLARYGAETVVMYLISGHYRQPLNYSEAALEQAKANVSRIRDTARRLVEGDSPPDMRPIADRFHEALADDFNTPRALAAVFDWVREANRRTDSVGARDLREMLSVLGLPQLLDDATPAPPAGVAERAAERERARAARDFDTADRLRAEIEELGWEVRDVAGEFELTPLAAS